MTRCAALVLCCVLILLPGLPGQSDSPQLIIATLASRSPHHVMPIVTPAQPETTLHSMSIRRWTTIGRSRVLLLTGHAAQVHAARYGNGHVAGHPVLQRSSHRVSDSGPQWTQEPALTVARCCLAATTGSDGTIYTFGGLDRDGNATATTEAFNPSTGTWATLADMPNPRSFAAAVTLGDGRIFVMGGLTAAGNPSAQVSIYDPQTNTWRGVPDLPTPRYGLAAAVGSDGRIYAIGGANRAGTLNTVEAWSMSSHSWHTKSPLQNDRFLLAAVAGPDGLIYALGGSSSSTTGPLASVEAFSPQQNRWTAVPSLPQAASGAAAAVGADGHLYLGGGYTGTYRRWVAGDNATPTTHLYSSNVWIYDPGKKHWSRGTPLSTARFALAAAVAGNGRLYLMGGATKTSRQSDTDVVEAFGPIVQFDSTEGTVGTSVSVQGSDFAPGSVVSFYVGHVGGQPIAIAHADQQGTLLAPFALRMPLSLPVGNNRIIAVDSIGGYPALVSYTVDPGDPPTPAPTDTPIPTNTPIPTVSPTDRPTDTPIPTMTTIPVRLALLVEEKHVSVGHPLHLRAILTSGSSHQRLVNQPLTFQIGSTTRIANTDRAGTARLTYINTSDPGTVPLLVTYPGDGVVYGPGSVQGSFGSRRIRTLIFEVGPIYGRHHQVITLHARVLDGELVTIRRPSGAPAQALVTFHLGHQAVVARIDATGAARARLTLTQPPGRYPLQVDFGGTTSWTPQQTIIPFVIGL